MTAEPLRPPAFSKGLLNVRRAGFHPLVVNVLYAAEWGPAKRYHQRAAVARERRVEPFSHRWRKLAGFPWLAVSPREYAAQVFDWRVLAGVMAQVLDPEGRALDDARPGRSFFDLVRELAGVAAVFVESPALGTAMSARQLAYEWSTFSGWRRVAWPAWWSDELEREHDGRYERWRGDAERYYAQRAA